MRKLAILTSILTLSAATILSGCVVSAQPATVSYSYGGWNPYYYQGALVYFDSFGRPYYYAGGVRVWVPSTWVQYNSAVSYYRVNRHRYTRWHGRYHRPSHFRYRRPVRTVHRTRVVHRRTPARTRTVRVRHKRR
ncbi:hypothetical protein KKF34_01345 [Myxococcota bacterium]|nr:hypothetical protein [Myxococcota bacterium]MBU1380047.1 hypothetical protein [Myxococcota bacterium]MBU1495505.1 hypothetical protein [Myxococcota bacterium]